MMLKRPSSFMSHALLLSAVAFLPACKPLDWMKEKVGGDSCSCHKEEVEDIKIEGVDPEILKDVVVSLEGKPVVLGRDYEKNFQMLLEAQPAFKDMLPYIPEERKDQIFEQILEGIVMEKLMMRWVHESGVDKQAEFVRNSRRAHEAVDRDLAMNAFQNEILKSIVPTEAELKQYYEENRAKEPVFQRAPFATVVTGVKAKSFVASSEQEARDLAGKVAKGIFEQVAKAAKKAIVDHGLVSAQSFIDADLKGKILSFTKFPSVEVIKGADGKFYVVKVLSRQEGKYADFDAVKDAAKQAFIGKKFNEIYTKKIADLKDKYKAEVNKDYLQKRKPKKEAAAKPAEATPAPVKAETEVEKKEAEKAKTAKTA